MNDDKELRERDKWIFEHLFEGVLKQQIIDGKVQYKLACSFGDIPSAGGIRGWGWNDTAEQALFHVPHFSTDPAAAMLVFEKCASHAKRSYGEPLLLEDTMHGYEIGLLGRNQDNTRRTTAKTWPLAICKFAKALFTKGK